MKLQFVIGEIPKAHAPFDGAERIKGCNCEHCTAVVAMRWRLRLELCELRRSRLITLT